MNTSVIIHPISAENDAQIASIIRQVLKEHGADKPGTVYYDSSTDHLSELFTTPGSTYFLVFVNNHLVGGGGIYPTVGLPAKTCELVKMYLLPEARGQGIGSMLIKKCLTAAKEMGYQYCYLETMPELKNALQVYAKNGFEYLPGPMGDSGHHGCTLWMLKQL
jgi:putative acetyltransferase